VSFGEQLKHKADEVHLQEKAKDFGDAVVEMAKAAMSLAAGYAQENRGKVDSALDKAEARIEEKTGGKHADTVTKVRASVDKGIDKLVEKHDATTASPTGAASSVPDDKHSAFDEESPAGSPS
jgi:hypothetical protein